MTISRRRFLGATAGLAVAPMFGGRASAALPREVDVVVVGAGAAGIAAARRIAASGRKVIVVEAAAQIGGRCQTDTTSFDAPFDRGARFLHNPDSNPLVRLARSEGFEIAPAAPGQKVRIGRRNARARETEDLLATMVRASRALGDAARGRADVSCAAALPNDLGDWTATVEFVLGPVATGKDLKDLSAIDGFRAQDRNAIIGVRQGLGGLLARLAAALPVTLSTPVTRIVWSGRDIGVETASGKIAARAIILTASTNVLSSGAIAFSPELPKRQLDAAGKLGLGSYDRIALSFKGNPLGLSRDEMMIERSDSARTAVLSANVNGSSLCTVDVAGAFGRDLSAQGEAAMQAFAVEWLSKLFGSDIAAAIDRKAATRWNAAPYVQGAMSAAAPGGAASRKVLAEPLGNLFIAGEATSDLMWGTVLGAWESGETAADAALKRIGPAKPAAAAEKPQRKPKPRRRNQEATGSADRWPGSR
ncbi:Twin-arginine translocation pathway signal [Rhodopseudomonas palustris HaA2]|uniref:Tryptophan 2-monooxygenase n=1 Tax=Rhodopseudomonas palustris (strain HaA2) TaxID=316058 RepID=Q2J450_RHOP2|nr:FAD-dependent oxidoreductase [Rhodopseudomonas palustris]ABD04760.1 Twin-arginine translocation pathway signal [Rhodopseudomonas palustris HaA2]